jgi:hypothetical protein
LISGQQFSTLDVQNLFIKQITFIFGLHFCLDSNFMLASVLHSQREKIKGLAKTDLTTYASIAFLQGCFGALLGCHLKLTPV